MGPRDMLNFLRRRFVLIVAVVAAGTGLSLVAAHELPRSYTARSVIVLEPDDPNLLDETATEQSATQTSRSELDTEADLMTSRIFAGRIVDNLNLIAEPDFNTFLRRHGTAPGRSVAGEERSALNPVRWLRSLFFGSSASADAPLPPSRVQRDRAISSFLSRLVLTRSGESLAMTVAVTDDTPEMAAALANATTRLFIAWSRDQKREQMTEAVEFLRQQAGEMASRIADIEREIAVYGQANKVSSDPRDDLLRAAMQQANEQLSAARGDFTQAQARLDQVRNSAAAGHAPAEMPGGSAAIDPLLTSDFLTSLRSDEAAVLRDRAQLTRNYGPNHPMIKETDAKIVSVRTLIAQEIGRIIANLENDVRVAQGRVAQFEKDLMAADGELRQRSLAEIRLRELSRDLLTEQKLYDVVAARLGKLDPYAKVAETGARVVSEAEVPTAPSFPRTHIVATGGFVGALFLGLVLAVTVEALDTRLRDPRRASQLLRLPLLASLPAVPRRFWQRSQPVVAYLLKHPRSALAERFRALYNACRRLSSGRARLAILVGSALPKDGGAVAGIGLAAAAAADGAKTLLVDLDFQSGTVHQELALSGRSKSVGDYLRGDCHLHDVLQTVPNLPQLHVLAAAGGHGNPAPPLSTGQLERLMKTVNLEFEVVVVSPPPLLVVDDAARIAHLVDTAVLVVACGQTTEDALLLAAERLHLAGAPLAGVVVSGVDPSFQSGPALALSRPNRKELGRYFTA